MHRGCRSGDDDAILDLAGPAQAFLGQVFFLDSGVTLGHTDRSAGGISVRAPSIWKEEVVMRKPFSRCFGMVGAGILLAPAFAGGAIPSDLQRGGRALTFDLSVDDDRGSTEPDLERMVHDAPAILVGYLNAHLNPLNPRGGVFAVISPDTTAWFMNQAMDSAIYSVDFELLYGKLLVADFKWLLFQQDRGIPLERRAISIVGSREGRLPWIIELRLPAEWEAGVPCEFLFAP